MGLQIFVFDEEKLCASFGCLPELELNEEFWTIVNDFKHVIWCNRKPDGSVLASVISRRCLCVSINPNNLVPKVRKITKEEIKADDILYKLLNHAMNSETNDSMKTPEEQKKKKEKPKTKDMEPFLLPNDLLLVQCFLFDSLREFRGDYRNLQTFWTLNVKHLDPLSEDKVFPLKLRSSFVRQWQNDNHSVPALFVLYPDFALEKNFNSFDFIRELIEGIFDNSYIYLFKKALPRVTLWKVGDYYRPDDDSLLGSNAKYYQSIIQLLFLKHCATWIDKSITSPTQTAVEIQEIPDILFVGYVLTQLLFDAHDAIKQLIAVGITLFVIGPDIKFCVKQFPAKRIQQKRILVPKRILLNRILVSF